MKTTTKLIKNYQTKYVTTLSVSIFILILFNSISFARDIENQIGENCTTYNDFTSEFLLVSYSEKGLVLQSNLNSYLPWVSKNIDLNLSLNIGYDDKSLIKMNSINLKSFLFQTYINAVYHNEKNGLEFCLSNSLLNDCLFEGMKLEFKTNPFTGSGSILFVMEL